MNYLMKYNKVIPTCDLKGLINNEPPKTIRVNTLRTSKIDLINKLTLKGFKISNHPLHEQALIINEEPFSVGATTEYLSGDYITQDAASMVAVSELRLKRGELVLDLSAAPGAKTTHISELLKNTGAIIACDPDKNRLRSVYYNCERMGCENVISLNIKGQDINKLGLVFDKVLLDAPCSCEGTLYKNPKVLSGAPYKRLIKEQLSLIEAGINVLKKGGLLVYSTCTINPDENEGVINHAINQGMRLIELDNKKGKPGIGLTKTKRFYPHTTMTQGFFIARLMK